jgi:hypothetical protein
MLTVSAGAGRNAERVEGCIHSLARTGHCCGPRTTGDPRVSVRDARPRASFTCGTVSSFVVASAAVSICHRHRREHRVRRRRHGGTLWTCTVPMQPPHQKSLQAD